MKTKKPILLLEDDTVDQQAIGRAFKEIKVVNTLDIVSNGEEGIDYLKKSHPVLILLDLNMPKMNGLEFLKIIKSDNNLKRIPVVILTTSNEERDKIATFDLGIAGYIVKPPNHSQLVEALHTLDLYWTISEISES